jgi:hypothetical protein
MATNEDVLNEVRKLLGPQEGICEGGVFVLKRDGWRLWRRQKFTQTGTAMDWATFEAKQLLAQHRFPRIRTSVVSAPETLEAVLADYEERRNTGEEPFTYPQ